MRPGYCYRQKYNKQKEQKNMKMLYWHKGKQKLHAKAERLPRPYLLLLYKIFICVYMQNIL